jgi:tetratricopeptide (TPR) repeat protein
MNGRLNRVLLAAAVFVAAPAASSFAQLHAQDAQGRFRIMVPRFSPDEGTDDDFGKDTAERIRDYLEDLASFAVIEEDDIEDAFKRFGIDMDDVVEGPNACAQYQQLGRQINSEVALCARYHEVGRDSVEVYDIAFWQLQQSQSFDIESFTVRDNDDEGAAERILEAFDRYVEQTERRLYCERYAQSQEWDDALNNCNQALRMNPRDLAVRSRRAYVYRQRGNLEDALVDYDTILELDPTNENALQAAGYVATMLGRSDEGRRHYSRYLQLNPGDVPVRRRIAFEIYDAGDPEGAMLLIQEGVGIEENPNLLIDLGRYAFLAAASVANDSTATGQGGEELSARESELYGTAVDALTRAYELQPDSMPASAAQNVISAYTRLGQEDEAIAFGEQATTTYPDEAQIWSAYAQALSRADRLDDALDAMAEVERIDPEYPQLYARQGIWLLDAERIEDAIPYLQRAVERGMDPDVMAQQLLQRAHANGIQGDNYQYALNLLVLAKESFEVTPAVRRALDFWHGYSLYAMGQAIQEGGTVASAQRSLPMFQQARRLFEAARGYEQVNNLDQYLSNTDQFIEIQNAIIRRGGA